MNKITCPICGAKRVKNGKSSSGKQRWLCRNCNQSTVRNYQNNYYKFRRFINWLMSKNSEEELNIPARTFRLHNEKFWAYWALPEYVDEVHKVVFCDGIYLARNVVVLIACTQENVLSWYLARSENSKSWSALMSKIAPPEIVVSDGGTGFRKALKNVWPTTNFQRCLFHVAQQIRRYTTLRPKLEAGIELLGLSRALLKIRTIEDSNLWKDAYIEWLFKWNAFLKEKSKNEYGQIIYTHERLRRARNALNRALNEESMFTYLNPLLNEGKNLPSTNNLIEGKVNSQLRNILRNHRGLPLIRRVKACYWWCYLHSPYVLQPKEMLASMPTDDDIDFYLSSLDDYKRNSSEVERWGDAIVWNEFHMSDPYPFNNY